MVDSTMGGDNFVKMKNRSFGLSFIFVLTLFVNMSLANLVMAESGTYLKIGFVDIDKIMRDSKAAKNAWEIYQKDFESKKAIIKEKSDQVANLDKDLNKTKQSSHKWKEKREKLDKEINELKSMGNDLDEELRKKDFELSRKILADVQQIINKIAGSEKYSIILDRKAGLVIENGSDLTDKVIKIYDAQEK
jgi:outer membrane protein